MHQRELAYVQKCVITVMNVLMLTGLRTMWADPMEGLLRQTAHAAVIYAILMSFELAWQMKYRRTEPLDPGDTDPKVGRNLIAAILLTIMLNQVTLSRWIVLSLWMDTLASYLISVSLAEIAINLLLPHRIAAWRKPPLDYVPPPNGE